MILEGLDLAQGKVVEGRRAAELLFPEASGEQ